MTETAQTAAEAYARYRDAFEHGALIQGAWHSEYADAYANANAYADADAYAYARKSAIKRLAFGMVECLARVPASAA